MASHKSLFLQSLVRRPCPKTAQSSSNFTRQVYEEAHIHAVVLVVLQIMQSLHYHSLALYYRKQAVTHENMSYRAYFGCTASLNAPVQCAFKIILLLIACLDRNFAILRSYHSQSHPPAAFSIVVKRSCHSSLSSTSPLSAEHAFCPRTSIADIANT